MTTVAVTGGSGFVGGAVIEALRGAGHTVLDIGRRPARTESDWFVPVRLTGTDLPDLGHMPLVHCAADISVTGSAEESLVTNLALTRAALAMTSGRIVHVSSSSVYDLTRPSRGVAPSVATGYRSGARQFANYGTAKLATEEEIVRARREAVILRPHAVYGAGDTTLMPQVRAAARGGFLVLPGGGRAIHALTWIGNLTGAVLASLEADLTGTHRLNVSDGDPVPLRSAFRAALGQPRLPVIPIPVPVARLLARATGERVLTEYAVLQTGLTRTYDLTETERVLHWRPLPGTLDRLAELGRGAASY